MSKYIVQAKDSNDSVVITPARKPAAPVVIKDEDEGKPVTFGGGRGRPGDKGDKGDPGLNTPVLYGTGDPPDPTGLPDGAVFFKYKE